MHRFHVPPDQARGSELHLSREESRHALNVLRLRSGDKVHVLDGAGAVLGCELIDVQSREARLKVLHRELRTADPFRITLVQAVVKGRAMDLILQKAVELGVHRIIPVITERTVAAVQGERADDKREKWHAVVVEAMKQSGNPWLPEVAVPIPFDEALSSMAEADLNLLASLQPDAIHMRTAFQDHQARRNSRPSSVSIWIGPEGDFTAGEVKRLVEGGGVSVSLGGNVLRSETAALTALALARHELTAPLT